jgi:hypothetical protein
MSVKDLARRPTTVTDLDALYREGFERDDRDVAYKTVATFAGLTGKNLCLKDGETAHTDGQEIVAPFASPYFYQHVEHELAHVLFESSVPAKRLFVAGYLEQTNASMQRLGLPLFDDDQVMALRSLVRTVVGVLEDIRVESLWGMLYPGSFNLMQEMHTNQFGPLLKAAHRSLESYIIIAGLYGRRATVHVPEGPFSRYRDLIRQAAKKVEGRDFVATLAVSKWLIQKLVEENLKGAEEKQARAAEMAQKILGTDPAVPVKPVPASADQRKRALDELLRTSDNTLSALSSIPDDWDEQESSERARSEAKKQVERALTAPTGNDEAMEQLIAQSEKRMAENIETIRAQLGAEADADGWLTRNAFGKVNLKDVKRSAPAPLDAQDAAAVQHLRANFNRILGRRRSALSDSGAHVDVHAYLEATLTGLPLPCFQVEERGRGFKVLVLLDLSSSMKGTKAQQAERSCRVLTESLKFPFVDFRVWGFQAHRNALDLTRFEPGVTRFSEDVKVGGNTPLHMALRVGVRFMEVGDEVKQIFIITDGWPSFTNDKGKFATKALRGFVRDEVRRARRLGILVTGIVIGKDMNDAGLHFMLGPPPNWKRVDKNNLGDSLVQAVSGNFVRYLRAG